MLNALLAAVGYKQTWHICWVAHLPGRVAIQGDGTYTFTPRLSASIISDLRVKLAEDTAAAGGGSVKPEQINITSLTKIGG